MANPRPVQFRAIHTKNRWRSASHETMKNALSGSSSNDTRSARALFEYRNKAVNYAKQGDPMYVVAWDPNADVGTIVRRDSTQSDGLQYAPIPLDDIQTFEQGNVPSDAELARYFVPRVQILPIPMVETLSELDAALHVQVAASMDMARERRLQRLAIADPVPQRIRVTTTAFVRNADVIAEVLYQAAGYCQLCSQPAPFQRATNNMPYLEVHHRVPLSAGGPDTVDNAIALCPNCHRQSHFG